MELEPHETLPVVESRFAEPGPEQLIALIVETELDAAARELLLKYFNGDTSLQGVRKLWLVIRAADQTTRAQVVVALLEFHLRLQRTFEIIKQDHALDAVREILRLKVQFSHQHVLQLIELLARELRSERFIGGDYPTYAVVKAIAEAGSQIDFSKASLDALETIRDILMDWPDTHAPRAARRLTAILAAYRTDIPCVLEAGDSWADQAIADWESMPEERRRAWAAFLQHAQNTSRAEAAQPWLQAARPLLKRVGVDAYLHYAMAWFGYLGNDTPRKNNSDTLRGLVHTALLLDEATIETLVPSLGDIVETGFRRANQGGLVSSKVGLAGLHTLAALPSMAPMAQLVRLKQRVKNVWARDEVLRVFQRAVLDRGFDPREVEEAIVPTYGFTDVGLRRESFGDYSAEMKLPFANAASAPSICWHGLGNKAQKSVPAIVKRDHADALKAFKKSGKDAMKMIGAQRSRLDRLYLQRKTWSLDTWRERFIDHRLVGTLGRRLIWTFSTKKTSRSGIWRNGSIVDPQGRALKVATSAEVTLWHPIDHDTSTILAWRQALMDWGITQPFKQAHRELYLLTDAERETRNYSNRFAGHILRQYHFNALRTSLNWQYSCMGNWDSYDAVPTLSVPQGDLQAEWWFQPIAEDEMGTGGVLLYVGTDQVRFYRGRKELELVDVPPLVFSEVMRDIDLFVGVCSIGTDPTWTDQADRLGELASYWRHFSFGALSTMAKTRHEVLERLLPRLSISNRCSLTNRFLVVQGDLRTYKIHLGSGNILMEPNDQYLCIVPKPSSRGSHGIMLPFEGDQTLSVILSKAFMLAADQTIDDSSILRQIRL